uniref:Leprecan-like alpha-helical domain-containing protein n=1 Tax=Esox lucius TaxID=8010 RepID=A0A6Q2XFJ1_ESOLU
MCFIASVVVAQYDNYDFQNIPQEELMPIQSAYGQALEYYAADNWKECIRYMELSLRLHRLLKDSVKYCIRHCNASHEQLRDHVFWRLAHFPALSLPYPTKEIIYDFENRSPYSYMHFAYVQEKSQPNRASLGCGGTGASCPGCASHKSPSTVSFLKAVTLFNSRDLHSSISDMEHALSQYLHQYHLCLAGCQWVCDTKDLYPTLEDAYVDVLKCQVKCEENLMPSVGGYFVEKLIATIYHYLQFAYYKLNDSRSAAPCASSYVLFDPEDEVMRQNMLYYRAYQEQWGLDDHSFIPRQEALNYYNQISTLKKDAGICRELQSEVR